jgi:hypothetical protein
MDAGKETIEKIQQMTEDRLIVEVDGRKYSAASLSPVIFEPHPETVIVHNLRGFCGFINNNIDGAPLNECLIVVNGHENVAIISPCHGEKREREVLVAAEINEYLQRFSFGKFMGQEEFAIQFRSLFVPKKGDDFEYVLSYTSKLTVGTQIDGDDDGITQKVQVKRGVSGALKEKVDLKSIVKLSPYRTFREVEQPESEFLLRVRLNQNDAPTVALFEADGGAWVNQATENIVNYIQALCPQIPVIA